MQILPSESLYGNNCSYRKYKISDAEARLLTTQVSCNGAPAVSIASNAYDRLGRHQATAYHGGMRRTSAYDLQGNMLTLTRQGMIAPGVYGQIDDITAIFNGNQTRDMSRGVSDVTYNVLNLPQRVEFAGGGRIDYLYAADGTKLAETVYDADGSLLSRRDYIGQFEFVADTLERTLLPEGYITAADSTFHAYIPDYQGNIVGVYNSATNTLEQFTDYYPYGLPHASSTSPTANRRKYGAKELTTDHGLNLCDFAARFHNPAFPAFTTVDPLAEKYYSTSPFAYCAGDPINLVDPTGMIIDTSLLSKENLEIWDNMIANLCAQSKLFNTLYTELQSSTNIYTIKPVSKLTGNVDEDATALFNSDSDEIQILTQQDELIFGANKIIEELFHAFQSETDYKGEQMNKEFEASIFKMGVNEERTYNSYGEEKITTVVYPPLQPIFDEITKSIMYTGNPFLFLEGLDANAFIALSSNYVEYFRSYNLKNANYYAPTTTVPIAIISLYNKTNW